MIKGSCVYDVVSVEGNINFSLRFWLCTSTVSIGIYFLVIEWETAETTDHLIHSSFHSRFTENSHGFLTWALTSGACIREWDPCQTEAFLTPASTPLSCLF